MGLFGLLSIKAKWETLDAERRAATLRELKGLASEVYARRDAPGMPIYDALAEARLDHVLGAAFPVSKIAKLLLSVGADGVGTLLEWLSREEGKTPE